MRILTDSNRLKLLNWQKWSLALF